MKPPKLAEALLRFVTRDDALVGDLAETYARDGRPPRWYWKEAVVAVVTYGLRRQRDAIAALLTGCAAGAVLFAVIGAGRHRAVSPFTVWILLMPAIAVELRIARVEPFRRRFALALLAFAVSIAFTWYAVHLDPRSVHGLPWWAYVWRIALTLALGAPFAAVMAAFSKVGRFRFIALPLIPAAVLYFHITFAQVLVPFHTFVNWRHDGWANAFAGLDVLLWAAIALLATRVIERQQHADAAER